MVSRRRLLTAGGLAVGAVTGLAACGSGTPGKSAKESRNTPSGSGPVTINFWKTKLTALEDRWYDSMCEKFNSSQSKVKVVMTQVPGDQWESKLKAAQAAGKAPDLYLSSGNNVAVQVRNGELADLTSLLPAQAWDDLTAAASEVITVEGKRFGYPMLFEPQTVLYYRKDLFSAAGLDPDLPPKSWADVISAGNKLKSEGRFSFLMGVTQGDFGWQSWGWQRNVAGHLPISDDWTTGRADSPAYAKLATFFRDLYSNGLIPRQSLGPANDSTPFGQNKGAMMMNGSWAISQILDEFKPLADKVGVAPLPTHDGQGTVPVTIGNMKWLVDGKSANPGAAAEFISWALAGEDHSVLLDYFKVTGYSKFPVRTSMEKSVAEAPDADTLNPWRKIIAEQVMPAAALEPAYDWTVAEAFGIAMEKCMRGADIPGALKEANTKINDIIKRLDLPSKVVKK